MWRPQGDLYLCRSRIGRVISFCVNRLAEAQRLVREWDENENVAQCLGQNLYDLTLLSRPQTPWAE